MHRSKNCISGKGSKANSWGKFLGCPKITSRVTILAKLLGTFIEWGIFHQIKSHSDQGCPTVALEQISRSAELRICSEALAPKMGLEQIRANICSKRANISSNWNKYLHPVANPLICQNDMEEPQKCTISRLNILNFLGVATQTPLPTPSKRYGRATKTHHFKLKFQNFLGVPPPEPTPTYPLKMVWKCTIFSRNPSPTYPLRMVWKSPQNAPF